MKRLPRLLALFCFLPLVVLSQDEESRFSEYGQLLITSLSSAPFPHPRRSAGHSYADTLFPADRHYSDSSVAVFVPNGFRKTKAVDLVIYLHGWRENVRDALAKYQLPQQLAESGKNAILLFPEGPRNAPDSFAGKLEDAGGLKRLVEEVVDVLFRRSIINTRSVGKIILSGHSGAYHGIAFALLRGGITGKVREVYLFDALYGETEKFTYWIDRFNGKLVNIYTDSGGTAWETRAMMEDLTGWGIPYLAKDEAAISSSDLRNNRLIFIHTDLGHYMVISARMQFRDYLKASGLSNR